MRKLYIFDMDGLLVDTERMMNESWYNSFKYYNLNITPEKTIELVGLSLSQIKNKILQWSNCNNFDEIHNYAINDFWMNAEKNGIEVKKGAIELLNYLKSNGVNIALATSTMKQRGLKILEQTKLLNFFDYMLFGDLVKRTKPDPEILKTILEKFSISAHDAIVFEDSYNGIKAANEAVIDVIFIKDLVDPNNLGEIKIHSSYESLIDYLNYLKN